MVFVPIHEIMILLIKIPFFNFFHYYLLNNWNRKLGIKINIQ